MHGKHKLVCWGGFPIDFTSVHTCLPLLSPLLEFLMDVIQQKRSSPKMALDLGVLNPSAQLSLQHHPKCEQGPNIFTIIEISIDIYSII